MRNALFTLLWYCVVMTSPLCAAEIVRCTDSQGRVSYEDATPVLQSNCKRLDDRMNIFSPPPIPPESPSATPRPAPAVAPAKPAGPPSSVAPSVSATTSDNPANLQALEAQLQAARAALAEQEAIRNGNERNYQRVLDRLKPYQDAVERIEREIESIQTRTK